LSGTAPDVGDGLFSYTALMALPTDPAALRRQLEQAQAAFAQRQSASRTQALHNIPVAQHATSTVTSISPSTQSSASSEFLTVEALLDSPVTPRVRAALFRMLATTPGAKYDGPTRDPLNRPATGCRSAQVQRSNASSSIGTHARF
jgi:hypothetical protein